MERRQGCRQATLPASPGPSALPFPARPSTGSHRRIRSHTWAVERGHVGFLGSMGVLQRKTVAFFLVQSFTWAWVVPYVQSVKSSLMRPWLLFVCSCKVCQGTKALQEKIRGWGCVCHFGDAKNTENDSKTRFWRTSCVKWKTFQLKWKFNMMSL